MSQLDVTLALVVSVSDGERVKRTAIHIGRCPACAGDVLIDGNANLQLLEQWSVGPLCLRVPPVSVARAEQVDEMDHGPSLFPPGEGPDTIRHAIRT